MKKYTYNVPFKFSGIKETKFPNKEFSIKTDAISFNSFYGNNALGKNNISNSKKNLIPKFQDIHISNVTCDGAANAVNMIIKELWGIDNIRVKRDHIMDKSHIIWSLLLN